MYKLFGLGFLMAVLVAPAMACDIGNFSSSGKVREEVGVPIEKGGIDPEGQQSDDGVLTVLNFQKKIAGAGKPVVFEIYAIPGCGYCELVKPVVEEVKKEMGSGYQFLELNLSGKGGITCREDAMRVHDFFVRHNIDRIPAFLCLQNGKLMGQVAGSVDAETLKAVIKTAFSNKPIDIREIAELG